MSLGAFPHIFKAIVDQVSHNTLLTVRLLSHAAREVAEARLFTHVEVTHEADGDGDLVHLERSGRRLPALPINSHAQFKVTKRSKTKPPRIEPDAADVAVRATWTRVLKHTQVIEAHSHCIDFPQLHDDTIIAAPSLRVVRGFRPRSIRSLSAPVYVDVWPTSHVYATKAPEAAAWALVGHPPPTTDRHVILTLINYSSPWSLRTLPQENRELVCPLLHWDEDDDLKHLVIIFKALKHDPRDGPKWHIMSPNFVPTEIAETADTFLYPFLLAVSQLAHQRYTIVGLEEVSPHFLGFKEALDAEDLLPHFRKMVYDAWVTFLDTEMGLDATDLPEDFDERIVTPEILAERVRVLSHAEWRDEIGREAYDDETFGDSAVDWKEVTGEPECCPWRTGSYRERLYVTSWGF